jgi:putative glutamine amidotransferase
VLGSRIAHSPERDELPDGRESPDEMHSVIIDPSSRLLDFCGASRTEVNSWHHQAVLEPAPGLRASAHAPDGVIEAIEWGDDSNWIVGVQWHPERVPGDSFAQALFRGLVAAAQLVHAEK